MKSSGPHTEAKSDAARLDNLTRALIRDFGLQAPADLRVAEAFNCIVTQVESEDTAALLDPKRFRATVIKHIKLPGGRTLTEMEACNLRLLLDKR